MNTALAEAILLAEDTIKMTFEEFKSRVLVGLATTFVAIAGFVALTLWSLNEKMAVVVEKVERHDQDIRDLRGELNRGRRYRLLPQKETDSDE